MTIGQRKKELDIRFNLLEQLISEFKTANIWEGTPKAIIEQFLLDNWEQGIQLIQYRLDTLDDVKHSWSPQEGQFHAQVWDENRDNVVTVEFYEGNAEKANRIAELIANTLNGR